MKKKARNRIIPLLLGIYFFLAITIVFHAYFHSVNVMAIPIQRELPKKNLPPKVANDLSKTKTTKPNKTNDSPLEKDLWQKPTDGQYPKLSAESTLRLHADLAHQRLYIYDRGDLIYTMVISSGLPDEENQTPTGQFEIQNIRGESFLTKS